MITILQQHGAALLVALPLLFAFLIPITAKLSEKLSKLVVFIGLALITLTAAIVSFDVFSTGTKLYVMGAGLPSVATPAGLTIPVRIVFEIDAFSAFMILIAALIAVVACIYSLRFIKEATNKYYSIFFLMLAGMFGLVSTADLFNLFVFIEVLSLASAGLIAFRHDEVESVEAAYKYLIISSLASLMILFAIGILYGQYGLLNIAALAKALRFSFVDIAALALLVSALAMKAGSVPMHFWAPDAYSRAPAPITASLVVASQTCLYALFRISFTLFGAFPLIHLIAWAIIILGLLSMFIGVTMALTQKDIKRLMAYHAISQTGYMLLGVGLGLLAINSAMVPFGLKAMEGGIFHIINHAMYKGLLFLTAGAIIYATGKRNLDELSGLAKKMPFTAIFFIIGAAAIAGLPPTNGFASKLLIYESAYMFNPLFSIIAMIVSVLTLVSFVKVFCAAFLGPELKELAEVKEVPKSMLFAMLLLAFFILLFGLFPSFVVKTIVEPAANALLNQAAYIGAVL